MKIMSILSLLWFTHSALAHGYPSLDARFVDSCTGQPVLFTNPNGTSLRLKATGFPKDQDIFLSFHWRISGAPPADEVNFSFVLQGGDEGDSRVHDFVTPNWKTLKAMLERTPDSRMLELKVEARGESVFQQAAANVLVASPGFEFFVKEDFPLCRYFTEASIRSGYYFNDGSSPIEVKRKFTQTAESGAGRQYLPVFYGGMGIDRYFNASFEMEREWELVSNQGGVFAERVHFTRYRATRFRWDPEAKGVCGAFVPSDHGILDVGKPVMDFFTIPKSASGEPDRIASFLNVLYPPGASCPVGSIPLIRKFPAFTEFQFHPIAQ
ncbi:MAG: hypothetical protein KGP28_05030 [Bdellovibrionales bacterium]|nr:hypothetical protein [Bdellovibrionales bacterium]